MAEDNHWHLDKRLNIGHLSMTFTLAAGLFIWASGIEQRIMVNTNSITHTKELIRIEQRYIKQTVGDIDGKVDKLDGKMDKVLERINRE